MASAARALFAVFESSVVRVRVPGDGGVQMICTKAVVVRWECDMSERRWQCASELPNGARSRSAVRALRVGTTSESTSTRPSPSPPLPPPPRLVYPRLSLSPFTSLYICILFCLQLYCSDGPCAQEESPQDRQSSQTPPRSRWRSRQRQCLRSPPRRAACCHPPSSGSQLHQSPLQGSQRI